MGKPADYKDDEDVFSQEEVNRFMREDRTKEATKARTKAEEDILKALGVENLEDAKATIAAKKKSDDEAQSEIDRAKSTEAENERKANEANATRSQLELTSKVEKALIRAGLTVEAAERARKLVDIGEKASDDDIKTAVEALKTDLPGVFAPPPEGAGDGQNKDLGPDGKPKVPPPPGSNPGARKDTKPPADPHKAALEKLYERYPNKRPKD